MTMQKLRWGVLGVSRFAMMKLLPATVRSEHNEVFAIGSRDLARSQQAAAQLGATRAYASYEEILADPEIDVVYIPLPNHMHKEWAIRSLRAGKHVLCEKPLGLNAGEVHEMIAERDRAGRQLMEAFMVRTQPAWVRAKAIVDSGELGELRSVIAAFSYNNLDAANIRNKADAGGGGIYDIGCYCINFARFILSAEPLRVASVIQRDPNWATDRLASAVLEFPQQQAVFTCSTQTVPYQRFHVLGNKGRVEIEIPVNSPPDRPTRLFVDIGGALDASGIRVEIFETADQYTIQADEFARALRGERPLPMTLEDSLANMRVIDAVFRSAETGRFESV